MIALVLKAVLAVNIAIIRLVQLLIVTIYESFFKKSNDDVLESDNQKPLQETSEIRSKRMELLPAIDAFVQEQNELRTETAERKIIKYYWPKLFYTEEEAISNVIFVFQGEFPLKGKIYTKLFKGQLVVEKWVNDFAVIESPVQKKLSIKTLSKSIQETIENECLEYDLCFLTGLRVNDGEAVFNALEALESTKEDFANKYGTEEQGEAWIDALEKRYNATAERIGIGLYKLTQQNNLMPE